MDVITYCSMYCSVLWSHETSLDDYDNMLALFIYILVALFIICHVINKHIPPL